MSKTNQNQKTYNYLTYGETCKAEEIKLFINHMVDTNSNETKPTPLCIWGHAGIGKTSIVEQIANEKGYEFRYVAPAQFEEMGDLIGMPYFDDQTGQTKFAKPDWVPTHEGPGIILIDDVNRADDRILRGIMQLLQNYELISWKLPKGWQIVLTANPDGGDYSVTSMDDAMITRMLHITMEFDVKEWAKWAEENTVDERGINFILSYPDLISTGQNNPRSMTNFFKSIKPIDDLRKNIKLLNILSKSSMNKEAAVAFQAFVNDNLIDLISPEDIITTKEWKKTENVILKSLFNNSDETMRSDVAFILTTRFINYLNNQVKNNRNFLKEEIENIRQFVSIEKLPKDLKMSLATDINSIASKDGSFRTILKQKGFLDQILA